MGEALARKYAATGRYALLRGSGARDVVGRRARLPPRRRRARDSAGGQRPRRSSAVRAGEGSRDPRAVGPHRIDRRHERRERRPFGRRRRDRRGQSRVLGHPRRKPGLAENRRVRGRVRDVRRTRSGAEDHGDGRARRQAAPDLLLRQQRRHRRRADRRRRAEQARARLRSARSVDLVRLERLRDLRRPRLQADPRRAADDGRLGSGRSPPDDRDRQDDEGLLARAGPEADRRLREPPVRLQDERRLHRRASRRRTRRATA